MILLNKFCRIHCYAYTIFNTHDTININYVLFSITSDPIAYMPQFRKARINIKNYKLSIEPFKIEKHGKFLKIVIYYGNVQKVRHIILRNDKDNEIQISVKDKDIEAKRTETKRISF